MFVAILLVILGLGILILGAESLVRGSASLAKKLGVSPLVIGLTVVSFGTSAPELVVNMYSAIKGAADIAIGNVIGSNIFNILVALGVAAIIRPMSIQKSTIWKEIPFALLAVILTFTMGNDELFDGSNFNTITRTDGFSLMALFAIFMFYIFGIAKAEGQVEEIKVYSYPISIAMTLAGLGFLYIGGRVLVNNAVILARLAGMSEALIGLTIIAIGTSLPELATTVVAAIHNQHDIAVGNVVGSNIFNILWILGLTSTILQLPINPVVNVDILICVLVTIILFIFMFVGNRHRLDRWQGILFLIIYIIYLAYSIKKGMV
ncbi:MAG: calcium/sodium antiporter [Candidatus Poribacteria bacterium]